MSRRENYLERMRAGAPLTAKPMPPPDLAADLASVNREIRLLLRQRRTIKRQLQHEADRERSH